MKTPPLWIAGAILLATILLHKPLGRWLVELIPALRRHVDRTVYGRWQGKYFTFDGKQVRFHLAGDGVVWIVEKDLQRLLRPAASHEELRRLGASRARLDESGLYALSEDAALRLLALRTNHRRALPEMIRLKRWLETDALPNVRRVARASI